MMRNLLIFGLLVLMLVAAQFSMSKTVDEVIERYLKARGGKQSLDALKSLHINGTKDLAGIRSNIRIIKEHGTLSRTDLETTDDKTIYLVTPEAGWVNISSIDIELYQLQPAIANSVELSLHDPFLQYAGKGSKVELLGKELIDDNKCYKIKLTSNNGLVNFAWIDTSTYLLKQTSGTFPGMPSETIIGDATAATVYGDYRKVNGLQLPHWVEVRSSGTGRTARYNFDKIAVNEPLNPETYLPA